MLPFMFDDRQSIDTLRLVYLASDGFVYELDALHNQAKPLRLGNTAKDVIRKVGFDANPHLFNLCCEYLDPHLLEDKTVEDIKTILPMEIYNEFFWTDRQFFQRLGDMGYSRAEVEDIWQTEREGRAEKLEIAHLKRMRMWNYDSALADELSDLEWDLLPMDNWPPTGCWWDPKDKSGKKKKAVKVG
jgi:hypothetical protein